MAERYVNYDKLLEERHRLGLDESSKIHKVNAFNQFIDHLPTADVVEVRHGVWLDNIEKITTLGGNGVPKEYLCGYKCSLCGRFEMRKEPYCNCGAKMGR